MSFLFFDIETRVDKALMHATILRGMEGSDDDAYRAFREQARRETGSDFAPLSFHVPISIALGTAGEDYVLGAVEVLKADAIGEAGVVRTFWERLEAFEGTLVSFNGRGFDLPVLELAGLRHGCAAPHYFGDRNGLRSRYGRHDDLCDYLTNFGATRLRGGFDLVSKLVGLPGKLEVSGADVQDLWEAARWEEIHRYCAQDVIQTYFLFLRIEQQRGRLSAERLAEVEAAATRFRAAIEPPAEPRR
jgi:hypothetical protein